MIKSRRMRVFLQERKWKWKKVIEEQLRDSCFHHSRLLSKFFSILSMANWQPILCYCCHSWNHDWRTKISNWENKNFHCFQLKFYFQFDSPRLDSWFMMIVQIKKFFKLKIDLILIELKKFLINRPLPGPSFNLFIIIASFSQKEEI
jgi:hypothetical protein